MIKDFGVERVSWIILVTSMYSQGSSQGREGERRVRARGDVTVETEALE